MLLNSIYLGKEIFNYQDDFRLPSLHEVVELVKYNK